MNDTPEVYTTPEALKQAVTAELVAIVTEAVPSGSEHNTEHTEGPEGTWSRETHTWRTPGELYATLAENSMGGRVVGWQFQTGKLDNPDSAYGTNEALTAWDDDQEVADFKAALAGVSTWMF